MEWALANPDRRVAAHGRYRRKHAKRLRIRLKKEAIQIKLNAIQRYGGECIVCGEDELAVLTFDHVNDDGAEERKREAGGIALYRRLLNLSAKRKDLQVMCFNCQYRKRTYGRDVSLWREKAILVK